jgi:hypothetical protein
MPKYEVSDEDLEEGYLRSFDTFDEQAAAERWAAVYCAYNAEYDVSQCFVRKPGGEWQRYEITIDSHPVFHAAITGGNE